MVSDFRKFATFGIDTGDWALFDDWNLHESTFCDKHPYGDEVPLEPSVIRDVLDLMNYEPFLASDRAYIVLKLIETEWGRIESDQREFLLPVLAEKYEKFRSSMSHFLIAELLGEYYASETSFTLLLSIKSRVTGPPRVLLPMAFSLIVRYSLENSLKKKAKETLYDLASINEPNDVREEAGMYIRKLDQLETSS